MENILWRAFFGIKRVLGKKEQGMGVIEIILIIVVLISLVVIFKGQISTLVNTLLKRVSERALNV